MLSFCPFKMMVEALTTPQQLSQSRDVLRDVYTCRGQCVTNYPCTVQSICKVEHIL